MAVIKFYLDEDISSTLAELVRAQGIDVVSAHELNRRGLRDDEQLRWSANEGRCLVTRNHRDFIRWTVRFMEREWPHRGVLIIPSTIPNNDYAGMARALTNFARQRDTELPDYGIDFLHHG